MQTAFSQYQLQQQVSAKVLKTAIETNTQLAQQLISQLANPAAAAVNGGLQSNNNPSNTGVFLNIRV